MANVLVTGASGYLGTVLVPYLEAAGHSVDGLDLGLYTRCGFGVESLSADRRDTRAVSAEDLEGYDAVVHLAALSNDPLGDLRAELTYAINHNGTMRVARLAKQAGVERFLFASSCSLYGDGGGGYVDETSPMAPVTPYGETKASAERELSALADDDFSPTYMRNSTVYGPSPGLRLDVVVNNLAASAVLRGEIVLTSDGSPWRPQVHVDDISRATSALLTAPRDVIHDEAFNIGSTEENFTVRDIAERVSAAAGDVPLTFSSDAGPDVRSYRVDFSKLAELVPDAAPKRRIDEGIADLLSEYERLEIPADAFDRFTRLREIRRLLDGGTLREDLTWA